MECPVRFVFPSRLSALGKYIHIPVSSLSTKMSKKGISSSLFSIARIPSELELTNTLPIFETDKILIKFMFHNILGQKENIIMGSFLETCIFSNFILLSQLYSITLCLESCNGNLKLKV